MAKRAILMCWMILLGVAGSAAQVPEPRKAVDRRPAKFGRILFATPEISAAHSGTERDLTPVMSPEPAQRTAFSPGATRTAGVRLVTTTNDTGAGSLRRAMDDANASAGYDEIRFQIPGGGPHTIVPQSPLPVVSDPLKIDGTTATGYFGQPLIHLDGSQAGLSNGIQIEAAQCTVRALSITRFTFSGIAVAGPAAQIEACYLGLEPDGVTSAGNILDGITAVSPDIRIGRPGGLPNVISGNGRSGIMITGAAAVGSVVTNSYVGTNWTADAPLPNGQWGIHVLNAENAVIGGTTSNARNILSGNTLAGIGIVGYDARNIVVQGNFIGTGADSRVPIPNHNNGVEVSSGQGGTGSPSNILIGGRTASGEGNVISGNNNAGVAFFLDGLGGSANVVAGNIIGTDAAALDTVPNTFGIYVNRPDSAAIMAGVRIGGPRLDSANIVSGNRAYGVWINGTGARNNVVAGNYIGISPTGGSVNFPRPNGDAGIILTDAGKNRIGGGDTLSGNVISANLRGGVAILGTGRQNLLVNNYIGTAPGRASTIGNGLNGIYIEAPQTIVGRIDSGNIIAHNALSGIFVLTGTGSTFRGNSLYRNGTMGIDLSPMYLTPNDTADADTGPNELLNFPIIDSVRIGPFQTVIHFRVSGAPGTGLTVDFYANDTLSASLFGEGQQYLGSKSIVILSDSQARASLSLPFAVNTDLHITAMSTDAQGNSSEFCRAYCLKDTDGDALADCWETPGIGMDINMDGLVDLDLALRGASPRHKDIFVEVDRMDPFDFDPRARDMARALFASAPNALVRNPDGLDGINLLIKYDPADTSIPYSPWAANPWPEFHAAKRAFLGTNLERAHPNGAMIIEAKRRVFRYCIFANSYDTTRSSGLAEYAPDNDFMVTLGEWYPAGGTVEEQAGTFVHELGHTLGLLHGGGDAINWKPNYLSVMNYLWQMPRPQLAGNELTWKPLFSPSRLDSLDESNLNDLKGLNVSPGVYPAAIFPYRSKTSIRTGLIYPGAPVDWGGDGDSSTTGGEAVNINALWDASSPAGQLLKGHSDWPALVYDMSISPTYQDPPAGVAPSSAFRTLVTGEPEMTVAMRDYIASLPSYGLIPSYRAPSIMPRDTSSVGGNRGMLQLDLGSPAPAGGVTYHFRSSAPDIIPAPSPLHVNQGSSGGWFEFTTRGVDRDTTVVLVVDSLWIPLSASITVHPARLERISALGDSGCVVTEQGGFRKRFLNGCVILFEAVLDGEAPPIGDTITVTTSRPDLVDAGMTIPIAGFSRGTLVVSDPGSTVGSPEEVIVTATYRGVSRSDTVTIMPAIRYVLTDISQQGKTGYNYQAINNAGDVLIDGITLRRNGSYIQLDTLPGFRLTNVTGMNDLGWFVGGIWDTTVNHLRAAYWKPDTTILLPSLDTFHPASEAVAINNRGVMIGRSSALTYPYESKPVVWQNDAITPLEGYLEYSLWAVGLNDSGQVIGTGTYYRASPYTNKRIAVRWDGGVLTPLFHPWGDFAFIQGTQIAANGTALVYGAPYFHFATNTVAPGFSPPSPYNRMIAHDMNDHLDVVGELQHDIEEVGVWYSSFVEKDGFLYDLKCLTDFPAGWTKMKATGINNSGTIVGVAEEGAEVRLFLLNPSVTANVDHAGAPRALPTEFQLLQNYPNPFNPQTTIAFTVPAVAHVTLTVFNILGQQIAQLVDEEKAPGFHRSLFDGAHLNSGVYFYRLKAGQFVDTKKFILLK